MTRLAFVLALLLGGLALAQPATYFAPIAARTPGTAPVGAAGMGTAIWLSDPGSDPAQSLLFGTGGGTSVPFRLDTQAVASVSGFPAQVDAVAAAPGVLVGPSSRTLLAILSNGAVTFGTVEGGVYVAKGPATPIDAGTQIALSAVPGGGAALLVADGFRITRFDLDVSSGQVVATQGFSIPASAGGTTDESSSLVFDGLTNQGFVGGRVLGDIYRFDARLDAGRPTVFDVALVSQGRLAPPVTGLAMYIVQDARYLLAANTQGLTVYDLLAVPSTATAFRVIPSDGLGPITAPAGVAVTNLPAGAALPGGVIAVGDRTQTDLALLRWDLLAGQVDGGLVSDPTYDPRNPVIIPDAGQPDAGPAPDGGSTNGPGPNPTPPPGQPVPVPPPSSCATAAGAPVLLAILAGLGLLLPPRRQRR